MKKEYSSYINKLRKINSSKVENIENSSFFEYIYGISKNMEESFIPTQIVIKDNKPEIAKFSFNNIDMISLNSAISDFDEEESNKFNISIDESMNKDSITLTLKKK